MIEAIRADLGTIRTAYSRRSGIYDRTVARVEWPAHVAAIEALAPHAGETIVDVAVGPGRSTLALAEQVGALGRVEAVDLSPGMLAIARRRVAEAGLANVTFHEASADQLPFPDGIADALYERLYPWMPSMLTLYLAGGCRPVLMAEPTRAAGFLSVHRHFLAAPMPSEIVLARRPLD